MNKGGDGTRLRVKWLHMLLRNWFECGNSSKTSPITPSSVPVTHLHNPFPSLSRSLHEIQNLETTTLQGQFAPDSILTIKKP